MPTPARNTADAVAASLAAAGVTSIYAYPGDPTIELMECSRQRGIDVVLARREGTAAFMAEAQAMATGRVGACVSTLGPGSTALVNGVAAATLDRVPMIAISGQIETAR
jgi:acetolactate synthase I/II/III large subunit